MGQRRYSLFSGIYGGDSGSASGVVMWASIESSGLSTPNVEGSLS